MKRPVPILTGLLVGALALSGCTSGGTPTAATPATSAPSSSAASASTSSASSSSAATTSSSATSSSARSSSSATESSDTDAATSSATGETTETSAATTIGGDTTELDPQTVTWFDTFCAGIAPFASLQNGTEQVDSVEDLSGLLTEIGATFTETSDSLATIPPPTFDGGEVLADRLVTNMAEGGALFTDFGERALALDPNDQVAGQQFLTEFQQAASAFQLTDFEVTPAITAAVREIPSCASTFG